MNNSTSFHQEKTNLNESRDIKSSFLESVVGKSGLFSSTLRGDTPNRTGKSSGRKTPQGSSSTRLDTTLDASMLYKESLLSRGLKTNVTPKSSTQKRQRSFSDANSSQIKLGKDRRRNSTSAASTVSAFVYS